MWLFFGTKILGVLLISYKNFFLKKKKTNVSNSVNIFFNPSLYVSELTREIEERNDVFNWSRGEDTSIGGKFADGKSSMIKCHLVFLFFADN